MHSDDDLAPTQGLPDTPADAAAGQGLAPGARVDRFRIESALGEGGMGAVYRAQQLEPVRRTVALKLLRGQRLDARQLAYFEVERQMLAQMQHPAIAQIFDAGTTADGLPYFAMEYIEGEPVTQWCDRRALPLDQRLALFARICEGVQHAHQKGVVHRDLKPGNILVTEVDGRPVPKIIDFGIATAAQRMRSADEAEAAGTPAYMSPEQAGVTGFVVDSRSDVYSLGVVLYELLTGARPPGATTGGHGGEDERTTLRPPSALVEATASGRELAALRGLPPRRLRSLLRHELDWVVMKAIRREPDQRYASAGELAAEIGRFLASRPLLAVPPTRRYVLGKFARRHALGLGAGSLVLLALLVGLAVSLWGLREAREQRAVAEARSAELERVSAFQQSMLEGVDVAAMGEGLLELQRLQLRRSNEADPAAAEAAVQRFDEAVAGISPADVARGVIDRHVLARALEAIERDFAGEPLLAADLELAIADVYFAIGEFAASEAAAARSRQHAEAAAGPLDRRSLAAAHAEAQAVHRQGRLEESLRLFTTAVESIDAAPPELRSALARRRGQLMLGRALALGDMGRLDEAARLQRELLDAMADDPEADPEQQMVVRNNHAITLIRLGRGPEAVREFEAVLAARRELLGPEHEDTLTSMSNVGAARGATGDFEGALAIQQESLALNRRVRGDEHPSTLAELNNVASTLYQLGRTDDALPMFEELVRLRERVLGPEHPQSLRALQNLAAVRNRQGDHAGALAAQQEVLALRTRTLGGDHPDTLASRETLVAILRDLGRFDDSVAEGRALQADRARVLGAAHPATARAEIILSDVLADAGRHEEAWATLDARWPGLRDAEGAADDPLAQEWALRRYELALELDHGDEAAALRSAWLDPLLARDPESLTPALRRERENVAEALSASTSGPARSPDR